MSSQRLAIVRRRGGDGSRSKEQEREEGQKPRRDEAPELIVMVWICECRHHPPDFSLVQLCLRLRQIKKQCRQLLLVFIFRHRSLLILQAVNFFFEFFFSR